ncbi:hypothetical protein P8452_38838 [Trifolium repens]|nr:hypothetical protein P8452_38838 [Trifolium repens]
MEEEPLESLKFLSRYSGYTKPWEKSLNKSEFLSRLQLIFSQRYSGYTKPWEKSTSLTSTSISTTNR